MKILKKLFENINFIWKVVQLRESKWKEEEEEEGYEGDEKEEEEEELL